MRAEELLQIAVFARAPVPGEAKTRLIQRLGAEGAAQLQARLIDAALAKACAVPGARVTLWWAGNAAHPFVVQAVQRFGITVSHQRGVDLGARMAHAFETVLRSTAATRCVLIGTDCPALKSDDVLLAGQRLHDHDVVVQPALDGGYVLIGLRVFRPRLFEGIPWGSATVLEETRARIAVLGLTYAELPPLPDLDTPDDYDRARAAGWI